MISVKVHPNKDVIKYTGSFISIRDI